MFPRDARKITDIFTPELQTRFAQGSYIAVRMESWSKQRSADGKPLVENRFTYDTPQRMLENFEFGIEHKQCWHEVIFDGPQKIRFDIDIDRKAWEKDTFAWSDVETYGVKVMKNIVKVFKEAFWVSLKGTNFVICTSSNDAKYSMHIIINGFYVENAKEAEWFCQQVCKLMQDDDTYPTTEYIDQSIYGSIKSLRIAGFSKLGQNRVKKIITNHTIQDSLIKWVDGCRKLERKTKDEVTAADGPTTIECADPKFKTIMDHVGDEFTFTHTKGPIMYFARTCTSFCACCGREHDKEGGYVFVMGESVFWKCWRSAKGKHVKIFGFEKPKIGSERLELPPHDPRLSTFDRAVEALREFYFSEHSCDSATTMLDRLTIYDSRQNMEKDFYQNIEEFRDYFKSKKIGGVFD